MIGWFPQRLEFCNTVRQDLHGLIKRVKERQRADRWRGTGERKNSRNPFCSFLRRRLRAKNSYWLILTE